MNSKEEETFFPNYVQEFGLWSFCQHLFLSMLNLVWLCCKITSILNLTKRNAVLSGRQNFYLYLADASPVLTKNLETLQIQYYCLIFDTDFHRTFKTQYGVYENACNSLHTYRKLYIFKNNCLTVFIEAGNKQRSFFAHLH